MKTGKTLSQLAAEIERQDESKKDYLADTRKLRLVVDDDNTPKLELDNGKRSLLAVNALAHRQIGEHTGIHARYYDRMLHGDPTTKPPMPPAPRLLADNVNHWFGTTPAIRMVRTLDDAARAFLSNKYQRIDNIHVAKSVLPVLGETKGVEVVSCDITPSKLYIKAVTHAVRAEVRSRRVGDLVEAGVCISNSEVGLGAINVDPFFYFLWCKNGAVRKKEGLRRAHLGTKLEEDELNALLADDTKRAEDKLLLLKVRDVVRAAMDEVRFREAIDHMEQATHQKIKGDPVQAVEVLGDVLTLTNDERGSVLRHLIEGGDLSRYGVMNAVTRTAEDAIDYDRATDLEIAGGRILDMRRDQWTEIAEAA